ncbi:hypothetical protein [Pseudooceanicola aestuarii]|uniref:hypothetical protein n=1 Tax=Pseudooceanicola aestuarii TaxID=2697319 RepID=UPI0013D4857F|nr:hypothetical protein [Pseudooceanicola aestuarii]
MTGWPVWRSDPALPGRLRPGQWVAALLAAWLLPALAGAALALSATAIAQLVGVDPGGLPFLGLILFYSPLFSWVGLLPGAGLLVLALRRGIGGWAMALGIGGILGAGLAGWLGPLAWIMGTGQSLLVWGIVMVMARRAARRT